MAPCIMFLPTRGKDNRSELDAAVALPIVLVHMTDIMDGENTAPSSDASNSESDANTSTSDMDASASNIVFRQQYRNWCPEWCFGQRYFR